MPSLKNSQKGQTSFRLECPDELAVHSVVSHRVGFEWDLAGIGDCFGYELVALPVAEPVGITGVLLWGGQRRGFDLNGGFFLNLESGRV